MEIFSARFLPAFRALIARLGEAGYFSEVAGRECDGWPTGIDFDRLEAATTEYTGLNRWVLKRTPAEVSDDDIISLIEALYGLVSEPIEESGHYHDFCRSYHYDRFDARNGRFEYTKSVNNCLGKFAPGVILRKGKLNYRGAVVPGIVRTSFRMVSFQDHEINRLVGLALDQYLDPDSRQRVSSLVHLANAIERSKTLLHGKKGPGASLLIETLEKDESLRNPLEVYLRSVTDNNNQFGLRHSEAGQVIVFPDRDDLVDFWFASLWALLSYFSRINELE